MTELDTKTLVLLVSSGVLGLVLFSWENYSAVLPLVIADLGLFGTEAGVVYPAYFIGYVLAISPAGIIADRYSARQLVGITAMGTGAFGVVFAFLTVDVVTGSAYRLLAGASFAGVYVPGMRLLADWFEPGERGRAIGPYVGVLSRRGWDSQRLAARYRAHERRFDPCWTGRGLAGGPFRPAGPAGHERYRTPRRVGPRMDHDPPRRGTD